MFSKIKDLNPKNAQLELQILALAGMLMRFFKAEFLLHFYRFTTQNIQSSIIVPNNNLENLFSKLLIVETLSDKAFYQICFNPSIIDNNKCQVIKTHFSENFHNREL